MKADQLNEFNKADYEENESVNLHSENALELAKEFGTPEEVEAMQRIMDQHMRRGHILPHEVEERNALTSKYYSMLEHSVNPTLRSKLEGYKVLPPMDKEKYQARNGLEGPFTTLSGKVVYYDPKEGKYYDPDTDIYLSYDEFQQYDNDYSGMGDEEADDFVKDIKPKETVKGPRGHLSSIVAEDLNKIARWESKLSKGEKIKRITVIKEGLDNDDTRNIAIRCVDEMVREGLIANDMDTDGDTEFQIQDIIHDQINKALNVSEAEVSVDNAGNIAGYLNTIDEYAEQVSLIDDQSRPEDIKEMAYRIQNAVDDIRMRELGLKPSNIRSQFESVKEATHSDAKPIYDLVGSLGAGKIELAQNPIFHKLVRFLDADTIEKFVADFRKKLDNGESIEEANEGKQSEKVRNIDNILKSMGADNPSDIIADIMHWIDANPDEDLESLIRRANGYYNNELGETDINEFGPDERYMKIGNNTMIANRKTGSVSSTLSLGGDKTATVNNHFNKDGSQGQISARGTVGGVKFKASNNINGNAPKATATHKGVTINRQGQLVNASKKPKKAEKK
jgi:Asp-tRNA(Asn)/Glu-tRNA(Gln) amidotransferase C subunit